MKEELKKLDPLSRRQFAAKRVHILGVGGKVGRTKQQSNSRFLEITFRRGFWREHVPHPALHLAWADNRYETGEEAGWGQGDWNADGLFSSDDLTAAFRDGGYNIGTRVPTAAVPEPSSSAFVLLGLHGIFLNRKRSFVVRVY